MDHLTDNKIYTYVYRVLFAVFGIILISNAFLGPLRRSEIENNEFPIISLQYRGSIFLADSDVEHIEEDFPALYSAAKSSLGDDFFWRMPQVSEGKWYVAYFPIYSLLCLPVKLLFQLLSLDQERCFTVTNALVVLLALWYVWRKLEVPLKQRLLAVAMLMVSPLYFNVIFPYYMTVMFALVTVSLVQYYNGHYKSSALLLSLAGMANSTIMAVGIVMVAEYLIKTVRAYLGGRRTWKEARGYILRTVGYGLCYIPSLAQFVINWIIGAEGFSPFGRLTDSHYYLARVLMYLFDPSLGFSSFAPLTIVVFLMLVVVGIFQKKTRALVWGGFLLGTVGAFSLMNHINCGMVYCARYLIFTWPIIPLFLATDGYDILKHIWSRRILYPVMLAVSCVLLCVNAPTRLQNFHFNPATQWILKNVPQLYAPYHATFYCRTLHVDGAYNITDPAYYLDPETDEVRKLIFKADEGQAERVLDDLTGDEASVEYLEEKLDSHGLDGKYHYVSFPASGKYQVREKTPEERGELASVATVVDGYDLVVGNAGDGMLVQFPFSIKEDTTYRVDVVLNEDTDFSEAEETGLVIDFYGPNYDRSEQQAAGFTKEGKYEYVFYFDSGDMDSETLDGCVRAFTLIRNGVTMELVMLRVTEMERTAA